VGVQFPLPAPSQIPISSLDSKSYRDRYSAEFGVFQVGHRIKVRNQVQCASTVLSRPWLRLQRTLFLLVSPIYAKLRNAQRTWYAIKVLAASRAFAACSLEVRVRRPSFRFQDYVADRIVKRGCEPLLRPDSDDRGLHFGTGAECLSYTSRKAKLYPK
jgi:hypothetical protein